MEEKEGGGRDVEEDGGKGGTGEVEGVATSAEVMRLRATWICSRGSKSEGKRIIESHND